MILSDLERAKQCLMDMLSTATGLLRFVRGLFMVLLEADPLHLVGNPIGRLHRLRIRN